MLYGEKFSMFNVECRVGAYSPMLLSVFINNLLKEVEVAGSGLH